LPPDETRGADDILSARSKDGRNWTTTLEINLRTLQAASRLDAKMLGYHLKRVLRNVLARRFPNAYARRLERLSTRVPVIASRGTGATGTAVMFVSRFYRDEYLDDMDDVARGHFTFFGQSVDFGSVAKIDWHHTIAVEKDLHLWRMKLAHLGFICPMLVSGTTAHHQAVEEILARFNASSSFAVDGCFSSYWFPYSASHRILSVLSGYLVARQERSLGASLVVAIEAFLRRDIAFVLDTIEHELKNNHVERNLAALCLYYSHAEEVPTSIAARLNRDVHRIILDCVLEDGLLSERSAMYQGLTVMALRVFQDTPFLDAATRKLARERLGLAEHAWAVMSHPDGEIALFNDSWFGEVPPVSALMEPASMETLEVLRHAGYARLQDETCFALFDAGAIGPYWNPGHGHADFLAVEIDLHGRRFIVDPGTYQYSTGERRRFERSAASHNGPGWREVEPVEYSGCFKVGRMSKAQLTECGPVEGGYRVSGALNLKRGTADRSITLRNGCLHVSDRWYGNLPRPRTNLLISADWKVVSCEGNHLQFAQDGIIVDMVIRKGRVADLCASSWASHYLQARQGWLITLEPSGTAELDWDVTSSAPAPICTKEQHDVVRSP